MQKFYGVFDGNGLSVVALNKYTQTMIVSRALVG